MIFGVNTNRWNDEEVVNRCKRLDIEYRGDFHLQQTKTKLASIMLKQAAADHFQQPLSSLKVSQSGKPFFPSGQFNITHHEHIALCVISETQPVGIDLTSSTTPFNSQELKLLFCKVPSQDGIAWAAREAYLKYIGTGLSEKPVQIMENTPELPGVESIGSASVVIENTRVWLFKVEEFVGAVIAPLDDIKRFIDIS